MECRRSREQSPGNCCVQLPATAVQQALAIAATGGPCHAPPPLSSHALVHAHADKEAGKGKKGGKAKRKAASNDEDDEYDPTHSPGGGGTKEFAICGRWLMGPAGGSGSILPFLQCLQLHPVMLLPG